MNPIVHGLLAWIVAALILPELRDRRFVVIAGVISDIDAILLLVNSELFYQYHHTLGHSFVFGVPLAFLFSISAKNRGRVFLGSINTFSIHLIADYFGSNWPLPIFYPFADLEFTSAGYLSYHTIYEVINPVVAILAMFVVFLIVYRKEISPFEFISANLDGKLVGLYVYPLKYRCELCSRVAFINCDCCGRKICSEHIGTILKWRCSECHGSTCD